MFVKVVDLELFGLNNIDIELIRDNAEPVDED